MENRGTLSIALAAVLCAATLACRSRDEKKKVDYVDAGAVAQDLAVLEQLRSAGSDLSKPTEIDFYLYLPYESDAQATAGELRSLGYDVALKEGANGETWLCLATRTMTPTAQGIADARVMFERIARRYGGVFDGWNAAIVR
jgi:hypothetical protein